MGRYSILHFIDYKYPHYEEDFEEVPYAAIEKWASVLDDTPTSPDFDTEVYNWLREHGSDETRQLIEMTARHFWEMAQNGGAMLHVADKSYKMGRRDKRFKLMKDAVEGIVIDEDMFGNKICVAKIPKDSRLKKRDLVKVIIIKAEEEQ